MACGCDRYCVGVLVSLMGRLDRQLVTRPVPEQQHRLYTVTYENSGGCGIDRDSAFRHYRQCRRPNPRPGPLKHFVRHIVVHITVQVRRHICNRIYDLYFVHLSGLLGHEVEKDLDLRMSSCLREQYPSAKVAICSRLVADGLLSHCTHRISCVSFDSESTACDTRFRPG